tara:strand:+ start:314 stop:682 length:369 start_codon:yes stop_codon:yes gene_type:complete
MKLLDLDWYNKTPIDFEHKQYLLYAYLQSVDKSYLLHKVSPHLLHLERLQQEMDYFMSKYILMRKAFDQNRYKYFSNPKLEGEQNDNVEEIIEIVDYSLPQIESRIRQGYLIFERYPKQILW